MEDITLGLSFSTRMLGLAVFEGNTLMDYFLKLHKAKWSGDKNELILASIASSMSHYAIAKIIVLLPADHCQTEDFRKLQSAIESFALEKGIKTIFYQAKDVYYAFGSPVKRTRNALMKRLVSFYPELEKYHDRELTNKNKYYVKLFEAVAVGAYHWLQQNQK